MIVDDALYLRWMKLSLGVSVGCLEFLVHGVIPVPTLEVLRCLYASGHVILGTCDFIPLYDMIWVSPFSMQP